MQSCETQTDRLRVVGGRRLRLGCCRLLVRLFRAAARCGGCERCLSLDELNEFDKLAEFDEFD